MYAMRLKFYLYIHELLFIEYIFVNNYLINRSKGDIMAIQILCATFYGVEGVIVNVEIDTSYGLPSFNIVGLGDAAVKESKERVRAAIINSGFEFPVSRITINLAPADLRKEGSHFDLSIAIGILAATNQVSPSDIEGYLFLGELSLNGYLKRVKGALPIVIEGTNKGISKYIIPIDNAEECSVIRSTDIYPMENLTQVIEFLRYKDMLPYRTSERINSHYNNNNLDLSDVIGQESAKRALEVAAAGNHNIIFHGSPGSGKTMLAQRVISILPSLTYDEAIEVTRIYSVSGGESKDGLITTRPFRNPHHTITSIALIGGGRNPAPGEASLAHNGVLFLDEILEFNKNSLQVLRQPLEEREVKLSRISGTIKYPANFMLIGALNPCPCGYFGTNVKRCKCTGHEIKRYLGRISGPLLDRVDIFSSINPISYDEINGEFKGESSFNIKKRVERAREIQSERFKEDNITCNSQMKEKHLKKYCNLDERSNKILKMAYNKLALSTRAYSRILKVARTIADLSEKENIDEKDIIEALQYRKFIDENII
jgi:magnesium chelatase family protein